MSSRDRTRAGQSFVERHALWSDDQFAAAKAVDDEIATRSLDVVRFSFVDQHGVLRGKTVMASEAAAVMRGGCTMTTTLLAKDTSHRSVFPVFTAGGGFGMAEMEGGADFLMIADPTHLPRAAVGGQHRLAAVRPLFPQRQAGAVLDPPALSRCARAARQGRFRFPRRA